MRSVLLYLAALSTAAVIVFVLAYTVGRRPSLERELAHRSVERRSEPEALTITALESEEPEEVEPVELLPPPDVQELTEQVTVTRYTRPPSGMVLLLDRGVLAPEGSRAFTPPGRFRRGLESFLRRLPASVSLGLRTLSSGFEGDCGGTVRLKGCGTWSPEELVGALRNAPLDGPRSLAVGLEEGADDLADVEGEQAIVVIVGGDEGCGGTPCQVVTDFARLGRQVRVFVVVLRPQQARSPYGEAPPPPWHSRMECLAERGNGRLYQASSAAELEGILLRIASTIQPNLTVRAFHSEGRELTGDNVEARDAWGVAVLPSGSAKAGESVLSFFPAVYSLPAGQYDLRVWYRGQEKVVQRLPLSAAERVEVVVDFGAGELVVQPKNAAGEELVGDTADFDCFWGVEIFNPADAGRDFGGGCAFPAYFVLQPGSYTLRIWNGTEEFWAEKVKVKEGETTARTVTFKKEE